MPGAWLKVLRDGGGSLNVQDVRGVSPLIAAAVVGDVRSIDALLGGGVSGAFCFVLVAALMTCRAQCRR